MLDRPLEFILNDALEQHGLLEIQHQLQKLVGNDDIWREFAPDIEKLKEKISEAMKQAA